MKTYYNAKRLKELREIVKENPELLIDFSHPNVKLFSIQNDVILVDTVEEARQVYDKLQKLVSDNANAIDLDNNEFTASELLERLKNVRFFATKRHFPLNTFKRETR